MLQVLTGSYLSAVNSDGTFTRSWYVFVYFRSLVGEVHNRLKSPSVSAGSGDDQHTKTYLATIQNDIQDLTLQV